MSVYVPVVALVVVVVMCFGSVMWLTRRQDRDHPAMRPGEDDQFGTWPRLRIPDELRQQEQADREERGQQ
jgi:hypothetical protein